MATAASRRNRIVGSLLCGALVAVLTLLVLVPGSPIAESVLRTSYDSLHILSPEPSLRGCPVVVVYIDLQSYEANHAEPGFPLPRKLHADLLDRLRRAGAAAVVFDIVFGSAAQDLSADERFAKAIRENGHVFLAGEYSYKQTHDTSEELPSIRLHKIEPPYAPFVEAAAGWGVAEHGIDDDFVVRRYFAGFPETGQPSLTWVAASKLNLPVTQRPFPMKSANDFWLRYYGPPLTIPHTSFARATSEDVSDEFFRGKIVFIGARAVVSRFQESQDEFRSPFHSWRTKELFMPGVEVHATEMLNLLRGDWIRRSDQAVEWVLLTVSALVFGGGLVWLRPIPATCTALLGSTVALCSAVLGFDRGIWFPWLVVSAVQVPSALGGSILYHSVEWLRMRRRLEAERRTAEAKIREQAALLDKANDAIMVQHLNGQIVYTNPSFERLYGWRSSDFQQQCVVADLFAPDPEGARTAREHALSRGEWMGELRQRTRQGRIITVASRWTLIRDENDKPSSLLLINSDITEQKALEAQFLRTQRMNTVGALAGGMAHDLNNALAPILMGVQLLRRKAGDDEAANLLGLMESSTHRSADMVRQVLLFARGHGREDERLEPGALVMEVEKIVRETFPRKISIETFIARDLWQIKGNPTAIHQVLLNLCVNARDAMPEGGRLSIAADNVTLGPDEVRGVPDARPGEYVSLLVSDTGMGMQPQVQARIFEPFFTTKEDGGGTGIGLATVSRIVKAHAGFIKVESEPGQGAAFEVFLPRAMETEPARADLVVKETPRGQGELILIADDERAIRELLSQALIGHGYQVLLAANGEEAVSLFRKNVNRIDLLFTDQSMPGRSGVEAALEIQNLKPSLPVIISSGEADGVPWKNVPGAVGIEKPFSLEDVLSAVDQALRQTKQDLTG